MNDIERSAKTKQSLQSPVPSKAGGYDRNALAETRLTNDRPGSEDLFDDHIKKANHDKELDDFFKEDPVLQKKKHILQSPKPV